MQKFHLKNYLNGAAHSSKHGTLDIIYPATNEIIGYAETAGPDEVELAVAGALRAQKEWATVPTAERARVLARAATLIRERNDELAGLEVLDTGKPIQEAEVVDIASGAEAVEYFSHAAAVLKGDYYPLGESHAYTIPEPLGVKSAPALAAGNAMIFKPSELTMITALRLAEIYREAGVPDGLFQVLLGDAELGKALVAHPGIAKISLTGEAETGKRVMAGAASTLKHVTLELGGKSPLVIFDDADLENAVQAAMLANFYTQGEICSNGTRVFVQAEIHDRFVERLTEFTKRLSIGDPQDPATQVGALISPEHREKVAGYIQKGLAEGAVRCVGSDEVALAGKFAHGNFVAPTIFRDCHDEMSIVREEIFGPVMCVLKFESEEEVIRRANDTPYGLAAGVFTQEIARGHRLARELEAGIVWINNYNLTPVEIPFGGSKHSGLGRENSLEALRAHT
eukprot:snap_masked-scaffold5340_size4734-processed-gene-0.0 protein:Tk10507 transcript:snap_masked-scaffold5340_size4734-processed-gene-0.0-mRNA-1 annotation:"betaine-aldehyde dehydrogenase"